MIQSVITHECSKCRSLNIVKNGTDYGSGYMVTDGDHAVL